MSEKLTKHCNINSPCPESYGPCKTDYECKRSLVCGFKNCDTILTHSSANKCCMNKSGIWFLDYTASFNLKIWYKELNISSDLFVFDIIESSVDECLIPGVKDDFINSKCPANIMPFTFLFTHCRHRTLSKCYCETFCSFDRCTLQKPPASCLDGVDSKWVWSSGSKSWIAQLNENGIQGHFIAFIFFEIIIHLPSKVIQAYLLIGLYFRSWFIYICW